MTRPSAIQQYLEGFPDKEQKTGPRPRIRTKSETPKPKRYLLPIEVAIDAAQRRAASGEWDGAKGATLVGLYAICHRMIYGIIPQELCEKALFNIAAKLAAVALHKHFDDDPSAAAAFVKWSWEREKRRDTWAREKMIDRARLSWKLQFSATLVTDWRVNAADRRSARR